MTQYEHFFTQFRSKDLTLKDSPRILQTSDLNRQNSPVVERYSKLAVYEMPKQSNTIY